MGQRTHVVQSNLTAGELSPDMWARVDHAIFFNGVSKAQNVVVMPHGGLRRRPGLTKTQDSETAQGRMFSFEFSTSQDYLVVLIPHTLKIYKDGVLQSTEASVYQTLDEIKEVDAAQTGDVMIFTHEDYTPQMLRREGTDVDWAFTPAPITNIPVYDFGTGDEPVWSVTRGWPITTTFFQARLWFGGSSQRPNSVWASKINSYYDFDIGAGEEDFAIFDTIDTDQFNKITNIFPGRNLIVMTQGGEFYNTADYITSSTSTWKRSTGYGSKRIRPIFLDGSVLFVDRIGRTVRQTVYEFEEDAYVSPSISLLSDHLITDVVSIDAVKGTNIDVSDFVYIINEDGTAAVLNTIRNEKIQGWTQWTTLGKFIDVCVVNKIVYFLCERNGEFHIEYINEGTTLDHNTFESGTAPTTYNAIHVNDNVVYSFDNVIFTDTSTGTPITEVDTGESPAIAAIPHKIILDGSMQGDQDGGVIVFDRPAYQYEVGLDVPLIVRTMPLSAQNQEGVTLNMRKRVTRLMLNLNDTLGVYGNDIKSPDRQFTVVLSQSTEPFTGMREIFLLGYNRVTIIELKQNDPLPFKLIGLGYEVEI